MKEEDNKLDFTNQSIFSGLDVHSKQWTVTHRTNNMELKTISVNPSPDELAKYLRTNYPGATYHTAYEAGFCGFWIHRRLKELGINNIVVNPGDVPTKNKERSNRNDSVDSRKIARELEKGNLEANYIPDIRMQELRSLCRLRRQLTKDISRTKNRIKSLLHFSGINFPDKDNNSYWSGAFIKYLEESEFSTQMGKETLLVLLDEFKYLRKKMTQVIKSLRTHAKKNDYHEGINLLTTVPGIGFITAVTFYTELMDIKRFKTLDELCSFVGLIPSVDASADREYVRGMSKRHNKYLRNVLIEAAWMAVRKDPALTKSFADLTKRMKKQHAIIRISKKLLNRIRYVWLNQKPYVISVVK